MYILLVVFFFKQKTAYEMRISDWSSDVCSSDLGAQLIAFPEVFIPGYPYWNWIMTPIQGSSWFEKLCLASIEIPGPEIRQVAQAARQHGVHVVIGVNERKIGRASCRESVCQYV